MTVEDPPGMYTSPPIDLGRAFVRPGGGVPAGAFVSLRYVYVAGHPVDDSGFIKVVFRSPADFGRPQFDDPATANFCSVTTTGDCRIEPRWDPKGHTRPWGHALFLQVRGGYLDRGQRIVVIFGDRAGGSPGWRTQTFCDRAFQFRTLVDPFACYQFAGLTRHPTLRIRPGPAARAVCIAPSQATVGRPFAWWLKLEDAWGNPLRRPRRRVHPGFDSPGVQTVEATDRTSGLTARSNPVEVLPAPPRLRRCWADFHGQSAETIGTGTIDEYFTFARDVALLDIAAHQGNDFQISDAFWEQINRTTRRFNRPGRFVTFPGYEWSGNTSLGGDRNVYFADEGGPILRSSMELLPGGSSAFPVAATADELFAMLARSDGPAPFVFAHVGGRYADLARHDPNIELAVEAHSSWGTFEWLIDDALRLGCRVGICANSDDHKCRPGAAYPGAGRFGSLGGLTCVLAERLDREHVLSALRAGHFYATTGQRALLDVSLRTAEGATATMGDSLRSRAGPAVLTVRAVGAAPIESVLVRDGLTVVRTIRPQDRSVRSEPGRRIKVAWSGARSRGRDRLANWDGSLTVRGNRIVAFAPVNFWGPPGAVRQTGAGRLEWNSVTTGGSAGVILALARPGAGHIEVRTGPRSARCRIGAIRQTPRVWQAGGLDLRLALSRLPDEPGSAECAFTVRLDRLRRGPHPIFVRVAQEDGHLAWSSPVWLTVSGRGT